MKLESRFIDYSIITKTQVIEVDPQEFDTREMSLDESGCILMAGNVGKAS